MAWFFGIILLVISVGLAVDYYARSTAAEITSSGLMHNERVRKAVCNLPDPGDSFTFTVLGDIQSGVGSLSRLSARIEEDGNIPFAIQTGDAVTNADEGYYHLLLTALAHADFPTRLFVVPGNHDVKKDSGKLFEEYFGPEELWFTYGTGLFVLMNNALAPFNEEQYNRLEQVLATHADQVDHIFLFMHRPPINWEGNTKEPVEGRYTRLLELLETYHVDYVFTGHYHGYHREERGGTIFLSNGQGGDYEHDDVLVPCCYTTVALNGSMVRDWVTELPPKASIVLQGRIQRLLIARIAPIASQTQWIASILVLMTGVCCILFGIQWRYAYRKALEHKMQGVVAGTGEINARG